MQKSTDTVTKIATVDEQGNVKPVVIMLDEPTHTAENNYRCGDERCICQPRRTWAPLHNSNGFSLLR